MASDDLPPPTRLMNFVSEEQLDEAKKTRGARVEDGTAQRDRSLYEVLKENKDKKDAEFNERFKHRPPKALDEDETEFLENLEMSRREYERQIADEEAQELQNFQVAVAAQSVIVTELKETPTTVTKIQEQKLVGKRNPQSRPLGVIVTVKSQAKKAKKDLANPMEVVSMAKVDKETIQSSGGGDGGGGGTLNKGLVSYSDESDEE